MRYPACCRRAAVVAAAPRTPLPFNTSTETLPRARRGCEGASATRRTGVAGRVAAVRCRACVLGEACRGGTRSRAPIATSATSSTAAIAPTTMVDVRQGKDRERCSACCTARIDSRRARPFLLGTFPGQPSPRLGEPVVERPLRPPGQLAGGERDLEHAALELAQPHGRELRFALDPGDALDRLVQLEHRRLDAGADIEHAAAVVERGEHRTHDVVDIDVVARLAAVAVDSGRTASV